MTRWRVVWEFWNGDGCWEPTVEDIPGGEFGRHGAREYADRLVKSGRRNVQVQSSADGFEWRVA